MPENTSKRTELFETLIELTSFFSKYVKITAYDKILFCIYRGSATPSELMDKLNISKGNLANYCKYLISYNKIKREKRNEGREIYYSITPKGNTSIEKILDNIEKVKNNINIKIKS